MKTKKLMALSLAAILAVGVLAACGQPKQEGAVDGKTVISVNRWPDKDADPKGYEKRMSETDEFMKANPDIVVKGDTSSYDVQTFLARAEGGTLPTLYNTFLTEAKKIYELGYAADITKQMKDFGYYDALNEYLVEKITFDGKMYYMPESIYTLGIVVNLDIYREAGFVNEDESLVVPQTFEELAEFAKTIYEKTGKAGFVMPTTENVGGWNFMPMAWGYGVTFMEQQDGEWKSTFDTKECVEALELLKKMKWEDKSLPDSTLINAAEAIKLVGTGQAAMTFAHPDQMKQLKTMYGLDINSIGAMKMPAGPVKHVTLLGGSHQVISGDADEAQKDACFKWMEFKGNTHKLTDVRKKNIETSYQENAEKGNIIGLRDLSKWNENSEREAYEEELIEKYINVNPKHLESYNDKDDIEYQLEEPVCTQDLYKLLDGCIQEVLTNKDADGAALIAEASKTFQENFLSYEN